MTLVALFLAATHTEWSIDAFSGRKHQGSSASGDWPSLNQGVTAAKPHLRSNSDHAVFTAGAGTSEARGSWWV